MVVELDEKGRVEGGSEESQVEEVGTEFREGAEDGSLVLSSIVT